MSLAAAAAMQSLMGTYFIYRYGSEPLRQRYLVPALRGDLVATFALTEPNAGSDLAGLTTRAERRGEGWVPKGTKTWVTNAPVADMLTSLHAATLMTYQAAGAIDAGRSVTREAAMTKLFASETAVRVTDEAARVLASYGLAMEYPVQRYFRDARFLLPGGGTSEILRLVISRDLAWDRATAFGPFDGNPAGSP